MTQPNPTLLPLATIAFTGADSAAFLQGQLTVNTTAMRAGTWRRAAHCSRQGRVLANGLLARLPAEADAFYFIVRADLATATAANLQKFVLRAKVRIAPLSAHITAPTLADPTLPPPAGGTLHGTPHGENGTAELGDGAGILRLTFTASPPPSENTANPDAQNDWWRNELRRGIPWIGAATSDLFLPQFINWDLLGGIDFDKGCFVGQEVIARLHHLGEAKRRAHLIHCESPLSAGAPLKTTEQKPAGDIIAASAPTASTTTWTALAAIAKSADPTTITAAATPITVTPPPYPITEPTKFKRRP